MVMAAPKGTTDSKAQARLQAWMNRGHKGNTVPSTFTPPPPTPAPMMSLSSRPSFGSRPPVGLPTQQTAGSPLTQPKQHGSITPNGALGFRLPQPLQPPHGGGGLKNNNPAQAPLQVARKSGAPVPPRSVGAPCAPPPPPADRSAHRTPSTILVSDDLEPSNLLTPPYFKSAPAKAHPPSADGQPAMGRPRPSFKSIPARQQHGGTSFPPSSLHNTGSSYSQAQAQAGGKRGGQGESEEPYSPSRSPVKQVPKSGAGGRGGGKGYSSSSSRNAASYEGRDASSPDPPQERWRGQSIPKLMKSMRKAPTEAPMPKKVPNENIRSSSDKVDSDYDDDTPMNGGRRRSSVRRSETRNTAEVQIDIRVCPDQPDRLECFMPVQKEFLEYPRGSKVLFGNPFGSRLDTVAESLNKAAIYIEGDEVSGFYSVFVENHGKPAYKQDSVAEPKFVYYWDERDGEFLSGWWVSMEIGADNFLAFNPDAADNPAWCDQKWKGEKEITLVEHVDAEDGVIIEYANGQVRIEAAQEWTIRHGIAMIKELFKKVEDIVDIESTQMSKMKIIGSSIPLELKQEALRGGYQIVLLNTPRVVSENTESDFLELCRKINLNPPVATQFFPSTSKCSWAGSAVLKFSSALDTSTALVALHEQIFEGRNLCADFIEDEPNATPMEIHWIYGKPDRRKTKSCEYLSRRLVCPRGTNCMYAHGPYELKSKEYGLTAMAPLECKFKVSKLPAKAVQSPTDLINFLRSVVLDVGLVETKIESVVPPVAILTYDTPENGVGALRSIDRIAQHQSVRLYMDWMNPTDFDHKYNGPPKEIIDHYTALLMKNAEAEVIDCWMYQYKRCTRERDCPFTHTAVKRETATDVPKAVSKSAPPLKTTTMKPMKVTNWFGESLESQSQLVVSNFHYDANVTEDYIKQLFSRFACDVEIYLVRNFMGAFSNQAFVALNLNSCLKALNTLHQFEVDGSPLEVHWRDSKSKRYMGPPPAVVAIYNTPRRRKTIMCWHVLQNHECPLDPNCPFAHNRDEKVKTGDLEYEVLISNIPPSMAKFDVEKELSQKGSVDCFKWDSCDASGQCPKSGKAIFSSPQQALDSLDFLGGMEISGWNLSAKFSEDQIAPPEVVEFYRRDRFSNTRMCDYANADVCKIESCPFAHAEDELYPCTPRTAQSPSWRSSQQKTTGIALQNFNDMMLPPKSSSLGDVISNANVMNMQNTTDAFSSGLNNTLSQNNAAMPIGLGSTTGNNLSASFLATAYIPPLSPPNVVMNTNSGERAAANSTSPVQKPRGGMGMVMNTNSGERAAANNRFTISPGVPLLPDPSIPPLGLNLPLLESPPKKDPKLIVPTGVPQMSFSSAPPLPPTGVPQMSFSSAPPLPPAMPPKSFSSSPPLPPAVPQMSFSSAQPLPPAVPPMSFSSSPPLPPAVPQMSFSSAPPLPPAVPQMSFSSDPSIPGISDGTTLLVPPQPVEQPISTTATSSFYQDRETTTSGQPPLSPRGDVESTPRSRLVQAAERKQEAVDNAPPKPEIMPPPSLDDTKGAPIHDESHPKGGAESALDYTKLPQTTSNGARIMSSSPIRRDAVEEKEKEKEEAAAAAAARARSKEKKEKKKTKEEEVKKRPPPPPEMEPIDFGALVGAKRKQEAQIDWSSKRAPLEWLEEDHEKLDRLKRKRKGRVVPIHVVGFPRTWDLRDMRAIMEKCGDLIDVILKEPGFVEVIVAESDAETWYDAAEQVKVEGNRLRVLNKPKRPSPPPDPPQEWTPAPPRTERSKEFESLPKRVKTAVYDDFV